MKHKKTPRRKLVEKLDKLWSQEVRKKMPRCIVCGATTNLNSHHAIVRKAQSLGVRWIVDNGVTLCFRDHILKLHGQQSDKEWLDRYIAILNEIIPIEKQRNIIEIGHQIAKFSQSDLEELVKEFEERLGIKNNT